jgi:peptidoglycan/xylan/chitin deacetylase (PgdA/CDA1 family)/folate-dependent phosphoribosylglycinamide formyltransferase PurN
MAKENKIRIVITTKGSLRHQIFLSMACQRFSDHIVGIFVQEPERERAISFSFRELAKKAVPDGFKDTIRIFLGDRNRERTYEDELREIFASVPVDYWKFTMAPVYFRSDVNSSETMNLLRQCRPDLVVVFGGSILKGDWLTAPVLGSINLHTGILPYYRSCNSNEYALYHDNFNRVGASVHYIDKGVDTGSIISRHPVDPRRFDDYEKLKARIFADGISGLIAATEAIIEEDDLLETTRETVPGSYYPHSVYSRFVGETARLRLRLSHDLAWPVFLRTDKRPRHTVRPGSNGIVNGVYILLYHGIYDPSDPAEWEKCFPRIHTAKDDFAAQLRHMRDIATPVKLCDVPDLLRMGPVDKPYFAVTFDDAYTSVARNAVSVCADFDVSPTVFVCGRFAEKTQANFRVLLAMLDRDGERALLREKFNQHLNIELPDDLSLLDFGKAYYQYRRMERAVFDAWETVHGPGFPDIHMDWGQIRELVAKGWEVGSHTLSHAMLGAIDYNDQKSEIEENQRVIEEAGVSCLRWLSYPYGAARHVNDATLRWMEENRDWNGIFARGGVNTFFARTDWMRIGIGQTSLEEFKQTLVQSPPEL